MVLNYIWIAFFLIAFVVGIIECILKGDFSIFSNMMTSSFAAAKDGFEISLGLTGVLSLWLGFMKIGEKGGMINFIAKAGSPVFSRLFPDIPKGHSSTGSIFMNLAANMLNLDNAATPLGLKAMKELQDLNPKKDFASDPMIMFVVLHASGLTIIPVMIMTYRAQMGSKNPADVFIPLLIATSMSALAGVIYVCIKQKIKFDRVLLLTLFSLLSFIAFIVWLFHVLPKNAVAQYSGYVANFLLIAIIVVFILSGIRKHINVYDAFIEGAKEGFHTAVMIIPYLIAMLVAISLFRASGAMDFLIGIIANFVHLCGLNADFVPALPTAIMKPLSGSGARGMMLEAMKTYGADSFVGRLSSVFQGSTDTTFYLLAVYFGAVNIKKTRYTVIGCLIADFVGMISAVFVCYLFFA